MQKHEKMKLMRKKIYMNKIQQKKQAVVLESQIKPVIPDTNINYIFATDFFF